MSEEQRGRRRRRASVSLCYYSQTSCRRTKISSRTNNASALHHLVRGSVSSVTRKSLTQRSLRSSVVSVLRLRRVGGHGEARFGCGHRAALWLMPSIFSQLLTLWDRVPRNPISARFSGRHHCRLSLWNFSPCLLSKAAAKNRFFDTLRSAPAAAGPVILSPPQRAFRSHHLLQLSFARHVVWHSVSAKISSAL